MPMQIFTYFDADKAREGDGELIRIWRISWERRGWTPRILTPRSAIAHPQYKLALSDYPDALSWLAFEQVGGGWLAEFNCINYSFSPNTPADVGLSRSSFMSYPAMVWATPQQAGRIAGLALGESESRGLTFEITSHCLELGEDGWETAPVVHFSRQAIFRHFGCDLPGWKVVTQCDRKF